ncbi:MAG: lipoate--protein ligase family protein [Candidatus Subteraquimicrobiales bacterium]|nr:lipoate--protein ligase family protein [Candidatus Subteraquimicrobiales bacterium]
MKGRFINSGTLNGLLNMSIDNAILDAHSFGYTLPTLRIYSWAFPTISFGHSQNIEGVLNLNFCQHKGIDIVKRPTGGGITLHGTDLSYSFIISRKFGLPSSILKSYRLVCSVLISALNSLGIEVEFASGSYYKNEICLGSLNETDLVHKGQKFGGNAQVWKEGTLLHQGTILLNFDRWLYKSIFSSEWLNKKGIPVDENVISLKEAINDVTVTSLKSALLVSFGEVFEIEFEEIGLSEREINHANAERAFFKRW